MTRSETIKFLILRSIGNFLVLFAIYGVFATFGSAMIAEAKYQISKARGVTYTIAQTETPTKTVVEKAQIEVTPTPLALADEGPASPRLAPALLRGRSTLARGEPTFASVLSGPKEQVLVPKDPNFSILIPKIGASAKVFPNVDPSNESEFLPILQEGIAHAKGTVFPGINGNIYLFAHSTDNWWNVGRYNAVFYLLKDLSVGDEIVVFFEGRRYNYVVTDTKTVAPTDVTALVNSHGGQQQLILQTCWPPGTTWERLLVIARPKSELNE